MGKIVVVCDRCEREIDGMIFKDDAGRTIGTAGFYEVRDGIWSQYANEGERWLCDCCMQKDTRYQADYGKGE